MPGCVMAQRRCHRLQIQECLSNRTQLVDILHFETAGPAIAEACGSCRILQMTSTASQLKVLERGLVCTSQDFWHITFSP